MRSRAFLLLALSCALVCCKEPVQTETLLVAGSSTMRAYLEPVVKAFVAERPSVSIVNQGGGSTAALIALNHAAIDIAGITRTVTAKEDDVYLRDYLIARDGIAIIVNPANPIDDLSVAQLAAIFEHRTQSWKAIGGAHQAIDVIVREKKSNVLRSLEDLLIDGDELPAFSRVASSPTEMLDAVRSTPSAIGFVTLHTVGPGVKVLRVNGVEMSRVTLLSGRYPLARSFYLVMHLNASPLAERFIDFVLSKEGQDLLMSHGLVEVF